MRLSPASTSCCGGRDPLLSSIPRHPVRRSPPGHSPCPALLPERRRRVRPRHGVVEQESVCSAPVTHTATSTGHRLDRRSLHQVVHPPRRASRLHRHRAPRDHAQPAARQVGVRPDIARGAGCTPALRGTAEAGATPGGGMDGRPVVSPYDAELYGHWGTLGRLSSATCSVTHQPGRHRDHHARRLSDCYPPTTATPCVVVGAKGYNDYWLTRATLGPRHCTPPPSGWSNWRGATRAPTR